MAIITYPLNDIGYVAEDAETYLSTRISGIYAQDHFPITITGNYEITIGKGLAWVRNGEFAGKSIASTSEVTLAFEYADGIDDRIDAVVLRFDKAQNRSYFAVKRGELSQNPVRPAIEQTELIYELCLAMVMRPAGSVSITQENITSTILDESICGLMRDGVTSIPTQQLQAQAVAVMNSLQNDYHQEFLAWFEGVKGILGEDEAGALLVLIQETDDRLSQRLDVAEGNINAHNANISSLQNQVSSLNTGLGNTNSKVNANYQEFKASEGNLQNQIEEVNGKVDDGFANIQPKINAVVNPNLLDNWLFIDPVLSEYRTVFPPGTPVFTDPLLSPGSEALLSFYSMTDALTPEGTAKSIIETNPNTGSVTRFYMSNDYTSTEVGFVGENIYSYDRWKIHHNVYVSHQAISVIKCLQFYLPSSASQARWRNFFSQLLEFPRSFTGQTVTLSFLVKVISGTVLATIYDSTGHGSNEVAGGGSYLPEDCWQLISVTHTVDTAGLQRVSLHDVTGEGVSMFVLAAKLEIGEAQTLAEKHSTAYDGFYRLKDFSWNKGMQIKNCERFRKRLFDTNEVHVLSNEGWGAQAVSNKVTLHTFQRPLEFRTYPTVKVIWGYPKLGSGGLSAKARIYDFETGNWQNGDIIVDNNKLVSFRFNNAIRTNAVGFSSLGEQIILDANI